MGIILSLVKAIAPFAILGAIGAYYVLNPRRPPPRTVRGAGGPDPRSESISGVNKEKTGKGKRAVRAGDSETNVVPSIAKLAPPPVLPGSLFEASASDTPTRPSPSRELSKQKQKRPLVSSVASLTADTASDTGADLSGKESAAKKKRKPKKAANTATPLGPPPVPTAPTAASNALDDGPWTRVETRGTKKTTTKPGTTVKSGGGGSPSISSSGLTTEEDLESSQVVTPAASAAATAPAKIDRQTLAERLVPRAPPTQVDDMLETPHDAALARVMRIAPAPGDVPATGSWGDYEDVSAGDTGAGSDDGFTPVVKARAKQRIPRQPSDASTSSAQPTSYSSDSKSKKQRQNAARRDAVKGEKAEAELHRQSLLEKNRRERITDIYSTGGGRTLSGGQKASVDENIHLTWGS